MASLPVVLDWDDTLVRDGEWIEGAREFVRWCGRQGYKIVVASARANYPEGRAQIERLLTAAGFRDIPVHPKPHGFAYVDDKAIAPIPGNWTNLREKVRMLAKA